MISLAVVVASSLALFNKGELDFSVSHSAQMNGVFHLVARHLDVSTDAKLPLNVFFPLSSQCNRYLEVRVTIGECESGARFDKTRRICRSDEICSKRDEQIIEYPFLVDQIKNPKNLSGVILERNDLPSWSIGSEMLPSFRSCDGYYLMSSVWKTCDDGIYSYKERECVKSDIASNCTVTQETDEWPRKKKYVKHETDCDKFYWYDDDVLRVEQCEIGNLFNEDLQMCDDEDFVECDDVEKKFP